MTPEAGKKSSQLYAFLVKCWYINKPQFFFDSRVQLHKFSHDVKIVLRILTN